MKRIVIIVLLFLLIFILDSIYKHPVNRLLDKIFLIKVNQYFDKTFLGEIYLRSQEEKISEISFFSNGTTTYKPITGIIDINTWREVDSDISNISKFVDKNYCYDLITVDGGSYLVISDTLEKN